MLSALIVSAFVATSAPAAQADPLCASVARAYDAALAAPRAFAPLRQPDDTVAPLPGLDPCAVFYAGGVNLRCLGPAASTPDQEDEAVRRFADTLSPCLARLGMAREEAPEGSKFGVYFSAGPTRPFVQIEMAVVATATGPQRRAQFLMVGPVQARVGP